MLVGEAVRPQSCLMLLSRCMSPVLAMSGQTLMQDFETFMGTLHACTCADPYPQSPPHTHLPYTHSGGFCWCLRSVALPSWGACLARSTHSSRAAPGRAWWRHAQPQEEEGGTCQQTHPTSPLPETKTGSHHRASTSKRAGTHTRQPLLHQKRVRLLRAGMPPLSPHCRTRAGVLLWVPGGVPHWPPAGASMLMLGCGSSGRRSRACATDATTPAAGTWTGAAGPTWHRAPSRSWSSRGSVHGAHSRCVAELLSFPNDPSIQIKHPNNSYFARV